MLDCPLYASNELTLQMVCDLLESKLNYTPSSLQSNCAWYNCIDSYRTFCVVDLNIYTPADAEYDIDWINFTESIRQTSLERLSCSRLNIEHKGYENIIDVLKLLSIYTLELWIMTSSDSEPYISGRQLLDRIASDKPLF